MKIGVYFTPTRSDGGVYQYCTSFLESLSNIDGNSYVIFSTSKDIPIEFYNFNNFKIIDMKIGFTGLIHKWNSVVSYSLSLFFKMFPKINKQSKLLALASGLYKLSQYGMNKLFENEKLDIIFFPTPFEISTFTSIPSIVSVHDLQHRVHPNFKEVSANGVGRHRDFNYESISKSAFRIFVDSEVGKEDMLRFYPKSEAKVVVLPHLAPSYVNRNIPAKELELVKEKYSLPDDYIFYPAKFWPHKNHINIIRALAILKEQGRRINLVLTGSKDADFSSFNKVITFVKKNDLTNQIFYLGIISNEDLSSVYKLATVMVMPTFFGPTNIPVLEAWKMGTPVIYSDIRGCREQLGDAGLLINPNSPGDIADKIIKIYTQPKLARELVRRGWIRLNKWTFADFSRRIKKVLNVYEKEKRFAQKDN